MLALRACSCHSSPFPPPPPFTNFHGGPTIATPPLSIPTGLSSTLATLPFMFMLYGSFILNLWRCSCRGVLWFRGCKRPCRFMLEIGIKIETKGGSNAGPNVYRRCKRSQSDQSVPFSRTMEKGWNFEAGLKLWSNPGPPLSAEKLDLSARQRNNTAFKQFSLGVRSTLWDESRRERKGKRWLRPGSEIAVSRWTLYELMYRYNGGARSRRGCESTVC